MATAISIGFFSNFGRHEAPPPASSIARATRVVVVVEEAAEGDHEAPSGVPGNALIWAYIKQHDLQDPKNKNIIACAEKLKSLFGGRERVGFLEISGLLNPHFGK